jgi:hypothetical protein
VRGDPDECRMKQLRSQPERRYLVPRPQPHDRLGLCQASSEHAVRRSIGRHRNRHFPERPTAS